MPIRPYKALFQILVVIALIILAFYLAPVVEESSRLSGLVHDFGYLGVFIVAIIGGLNLFVPIPAITFLPVFLAADLNLTLIVLTIALGATLADSIAYLLGRAGRNIVSYEHNRQILEFVDGIHKKGRHAMAIVLLLFASFVPLPNEVLVAPYAFFGFKFRQIFPLILIGNIIFNTLGALGISQFVKI